MNIVVIEDDRNAAEFVNFALLAGWPGIQLYFAYKGVQGVELVKEKSPDIVLLDLGLPDIDGFEVLKQIRNFTKVPVMILTVMDEEHKLVKAFELGADEYIVKPFGQMEIVSRIKAVFRRIQTSKKESDVLAFGPWHFDPKKHEVYNDDFQIFLTPTESRILYLLILNSEEGVSNDTIAEEIWGTEYPGSTDAIRVYISRLRQKIEIDPRCKSMIQVKSGFGYSIKL